MCGVDGGGWSQGNGVLGLSLIVERALLPGHGLDGARHGRRLQRGRSVRMEGVAEGVDGGEGPLGSQGESVLMLRHGVGAQSSVSRAHLLYLRHQGLEQRVGGGRGCTGGGDVFVRRGAPHALLAALGRH